MRKGLEKGADGAISIDRSAIIVVRGWIPAQYKDKRSRPQEATQEKRLIKMTGTWLKGKDLHDYKVPNNPDNNEWHNLALEDIGLFWDLPNFDECKFYYFRAVNFGSNDATGTLLDIATPAKADSKDEVIEMHYGWRCSEILHKQLMLATGGLSAVSSAVFLTAVSLL